MLVVATRVPSALVERSALARLVTAKFVVVALVVVAFVAMKFVVVRFMIVATVAESVSIMALVKRPSVAKKVVDVALRMVELAAVTFPAKVAFPA